MPSRTRSTKRERNVKSATKTNLTATETTLITKVSYIESISAPENVAAFLVNADLFALYSCSHRLHDNFCATYVPRVRWCLQGLAELSNKTQKLIRKLLIEHEIDKVNLSSCTDIKFGEMWEPKNLKDLLRSSSCDVLKSIEFGRRFDLPIDLGTFPESLTYLKFGSYFRQPLDVGVLPPGLKVLIFGRYYSQKLDARALPSGLEVLDLGESVCELTSSLESLPFLTSMKFAELSDKAISIHLLPRGLTSLVMSKKFNQPLELGCLPSGLTYLELGDAFNHPLEPGMLPASLTYLHVSHFTNGLKPGVLPEALICLNATQGSVSCKEGVLPSKLESLSAAHFNISFCQVPSRTRHGFHAKYKEMTKQIVPASLTNLRVTFLCEFPTGLKALTLLRDDFKSWCLPTSLTYLELGCFDKVKLPIRVLPRNLTELKIAGHRLALQLDVLPANLVKFSCNGELGPLVPNVFPPSLRTLKFHDFQASLSVKKSVLPSGLTDLCLGNFNRPLKRGALPSGLKKLNLGRRYNLPLEPGALPSGLTVLYLGPQFDQDLTKDVLPPNLFELQVSARKGLREVLPKSVGIVRFLKGSETLPGIRVIID